MGFRGFGLALASTVVALAIWAPSASAQFGVAFWDAGTCATNVEPAAQCNSAHPERAYTQAAGHPQFGFTEFRFNTDGLGLPDGKIRDVRVDLPKGLAVNPQATPMCTQAQLEASACPVDSLVGTNYATLVNLLTLIPATVPIPVYNVVPKDGQPARFGMTVPVVGGQIYLDGGIAYETDYHTYFTIHVADSVPLAATRLVFNGRAGDGTLLTLPSQCSASPADFPITKLEVTSYADEHLGPIEAQTPVGVDGCGAVPFHPTISVTPDTTAADQPVGVDVDVTMPQSPNGALNPNTSTLRTARVTLPEGMTINPAVATGLQACTDEQLGKGTSRPVECPAASRVGSVTLDAPALPAGSLTGDVFVGQPRSQDPASGEMYRLFVVAGSARYGVSVRLIGNISADPQTGRLTTTFAENPDVPLKRFHLHFDGGPRAALATPMACGPATTESTLTPWSGQGDASPTSSFAVDGCDQPLAPQFSASSRTTKAGASTAFDVDVSRASGQPRLERLSFDLPAGLIGLVSKVPRCGPEDAAAGSCPASSRIGSTTVSAGSGPEPFSLPGDVYLTGGYAGAPYGLSIVVHAVAGPFDLGLVVVRAGIRVDPHDAHLSVVSDPLPTIVGGVPLRLRQVHVAIDREGFMLNPTSCAEKATTGLVDGLGSSAAISSPFQATDCAALPFAPQFTATSNGTLRFKKGAELNVHVGMPAGSANIASISVRLPKELPSRLIPTINNACLISQYQADYRKCPIDSYVGTVTARTPVLDEPLTGPAHIMAIPNDVPRLVLRLQGQGDAAGVEVLLEGTIIINSGGGRTKSTFATIPDVPITSFDLNLPTGPHSALDAPSYDLCKGPISMDVSIVGQNGARQDSTKKIAMKDCPKYGKPKIVSVKATRAGVQLRIKPPANAGRLTVKGKGLKTVPRKVDRKVTYSVRLPLTKAGKRAANSRRGLSTRLSVTFKPTNAPKASTVRSKVVRVKR